MGIKRGLESFSYKLHSQSDDHDWSSFCYDIISNLYLLADHDLRLGQAIMVCLDNDLYDKITGTRFDIWQVTDPTDKKLDLFIDQIFNLYVEAL